MRRLRALNHSTVRPTLSLVTAAAATTLSSPILTAGSVRSCHASSSAEDATTPTQVHDDQQQQQIDAIRSQLLFPKELQFSNDFLQSPINLHLQLLQEAHRKHSVYLNVPPQLPPSGSPPEVPEVIYSEEQAQQMRKTKLAYPPTHGPPPLATCGTRGLNFEDASTVVATAAAAAAPAATVVSSTSDPSSPFQCSACGKTFRLQLSAEHHVKEFHQGGGGGATPPSASSSREKSSSATTTTTTTTTTAASTTASPPPSHLTSVVEKKTAYDAVPRDFVLIPPEDDVDELLKSIWDPVGMQRGGKAFTALADVVVGVADDRKPLSELDLKPLIRATPEGVAPGVKKRALQSSSSIAGRQQSIKELSARFPSPFGDSAQSKLLEQMKDEPLNPFLPLTPDVPDPSTGLVVGSPSLETAAKSRRFECHVCHVTFRLMDALLDHCESAHGLDVTPQELERLHKAKLKQNPMIAAAGTPQAQGSSSTASTAATNAEGGAAGGVFSSDELPTVPPPPVLEADVNVHLRAASNMVLLGSVVDVQAGFVQSTRVTQYVVKVSAAAGAADGDEQTSTTEAQQQQQHDNPSRTAEAEEESDEYVLVRVFGDQLKFTTDVVKVGTSVLVHGLLKMNRHTDTVSRKLHAYPYVHVCAPEGNVSLVESLR